MIRLQSYFEQIEEHIMNNPMTISFMECGNVVEINEGENFSVFAYPPQEAPIWAEMLGDGCTFIITKEYPSDDTWVFTIYRENHSDYDDPNYSPNNQCDCRNCKWFYLKHGSFYTCGGCGKDIIDPLMDECLAEAKPKKEVI